MTVLAVGVVFVLSAGEIDLSFGSMVAVSALAAAVVLGELPLAFGVIAGLGAGILVGLLNGVLVAYVRLPSFLVTLATLGLFAGVARAMTNLRSIPVTNDAFTGFFGSGSLAGIPSLVLWTVAVVAAGHFVYRETRLGAHVLATGDNPRAAEAAGINVPRVRLSVLAISGACAGLAGLLYAGRLQAAKYTLGESDLMTVLAAVIVGGTFAERGQGIGHRRAGRVAAHGHAQQRPHPDGALGLRADDRARPDHSGRGRRVPAGNQPMTVHQFPGRLTRCFLDILRRRNPALVEAAIALHQAGRIPANCYVLDLDAVEDNARAFRQRADALGLSVFAMTKQVGRNSGFCRALGRGGIDRAVAVDMACAQALRAAGMRVGHLGHLVQVPRFEAGRRRPRHRPGLLDGVQRRQGERGGRRRAPRRPAARSCSRASRPRETPFYRGHEGGFDAAGVAAVAAELDALGRRPIRRDHHLSCAAVRPRDRHRRAYPQSGDPEPRPGGAGESRALRTSRSTRPAPRRRWCLEMLGRTPGRRSASRATGCTGPRPCTRSGTFRRFRPCST